MDGFEFLRCHSEAHGRAAGDDVDALKFRNKAAVAGDADALADEGLQIDAGRRRDERQHLAALVDKRERRRAGTP